MYVVTDKAENMLDTLSPYLHIRRFPYKTKERYHQIQSNSGCLMGIDIIDINIYNIIHAPV